MFLVVAKPGHPSTAITVCSSCCQVPNEQASAECKAAATSHRNQSDDGTETPTQPDTTHPAPTDTNGDKDQTHPPSHRGEENPALTADDAH